ncbi:Regulator of nonsense transcripts 3A [Cyphomyrmex costatus]|uniref:Regulator of nonsense transcripts 3A n=1 Tax=Cyphomyrmex costatus TaxID=456900 RepID=A0A151IER5_9HYME|nr:Regulator of nonsense transcripts 3A [Cyphomyrmex costatus]
MTEEAQQSESAAQNDSCSVQNDSQNNSSDVGKAKDNKKEKCRPITKVVIRRLPPTMTQDQFLEQVSPLPEHEYLYFVKADMSLGQFSFSRAYINFVEQQDIFMFREKFDNYVFLDSKGVEYPAVVEFAPFQRLPKKRVGKKKDIKCGTIESDSYYISFLENLKNQEIDSSVTQSKTEYSYQPPDNTVKKITTTPLLEFLKLRKQERQRLRDEKREERRRKDPDRRRTKDEPIIPKHMHNMEDEQSPNSPTPHPTNVKFEDMFFQYFIENASTYKYEKYREEIFLNRFLYKRTQEKLCNTHERFYEHIRKTKPIRSMFDVKKQYLTGSNQVNRKTYLCFHKGDHVLRNPDLDKESSKDDKENKEERDKLSPKEMKNKNKRDEKVREKSMRDREMKPIIKGYRERVDDRNKEREIKQRRYDEKKPYGRRDEREDRRTEFRDDRRYEMKEDFRESRDRKVEERRGKSYEKMRQEKKKLAETKKQIADANGDDTISKKAKEEHDTVQEKENGNSKESVYNGDDLKQHSNDNECEQRNTTEDRITIDTIHNCQDSMEKGNGSVNADVNDEDDSENKESKVVKRRNSLESGGEGGAGDGNCLRRHKSLDGGDQSNLQKNDNEEKEKDKKDPRMERRIRNKDRPAMEIYRPGMGKFSKQRLEREKSNDERASLSQSPTPNPSVSSATGKPGKVGATEVRSMTFKRSVTRDAA